MLKIYLVRHGQNEDNSNGILNGHRDLPLTQTGREQARELAKLIKNSGINFDKVYTSPLSRAYETAEIITQELLINSDPEKNNLLIERDFGILTGQPYSQIPVVCGDNLIKTETVTYFLDPPGAETFPDLVIRANRFFDFLKSKSADGNILLVAHGDIGKMIYAAYYNLPWEQVLTQFHFGNSEMILMSPNSPPENAHVFKLKQYNI